MNGHIDIPDEIRKLARKPKKNEFPRSKVYCSVGYMLTFIWKIIHVSIVSEGILMKSFRKLSKYFSSNSSWK